MTPPRQSFRKPKKRRKPIARSPIARSKKRTAAQERTKHEREYGPPGRAEFVQSLPSVASGKGPCVNAHVGNKGAGTSRKADYDQIVPLTDHEHTVELHQMGRDSFQAKYGISFDQAMIDTESKWQASSHMERD